MSATELAWAAGIWDGEGCTYAAKHKFVMLTLGQSGDQCPEVLTRFQRAVGGGNITGPFGPYTVQRRPQWRWETTKRLEVEAVMAALWPYLGVVKREQFLAAKIKRAERLAEHLAKRVARAVA